MTTTSTPDPAMAGADPFGENVIKAKSQVTEKVRKLLAQAEDPAATPEEAQSFTEKAQQLMTKYSIDLAMITDAAKIDQVTEKGWILHGPYATHKVTLVNAVARANDCRAIYGDLGGGRKAIDVVGYPADVEWVETLSRSLEIQMAGALAAGMRHKPERVHGRTFAVGFVQGFCAEISSRLQKARREAVAAAHSSREDQRRAEVRAAMEAGLVVEPPAASVALVLIAKREQVESEFKVRHPHTRSVHRQVRLQSWSGWEPGQAAGSRASLARGHLGGSPRSLSA